MATSKKKVSLFAWNLGGTDPAIKADLLDADLYNWYGSSTLPEYLPFSEKVWRLRP